MSNIGHEEWRSMGGCGSIFWGVEIHAIPPSACSLPVVYRRGRRSSEDRRPPHAGRDGYAEQRQDARRDLRLAQNFLPRRTTGGAEIIKRHLAHLVGRAAMMAARRLAVIGGDDHLVAGLAPARQID